MASQVSGQSISGRRSQGTAPTRQTPTQYTHPRRAARRCCRAAGPPPPSPASWPPRPAGSSRAGTGARTRACGPRRSTGLLGCGCGRWMWICLSVGVNRTWPVRFDQRINGQNRPCNDWSSAAAPKSPKLACTDSCLLWLLLWWWSIHHETGRQGYCCVCKSQLLVGYVSLGYASIHAHTSFVPASVPVCICLNLRTRPYYAPGWP